MQMQRQSHCERLLLASRVSIHPSGWLSRMNTSRGYLPMTTVATTPSSHSCKRSLFTFCSSYSVAQHLHHLRHSNLQPDSKTASQHCLMLRSFSQQTSKSTNIEDTASGSEIPDAKSSKKPKKHSKRKMHKPKYRAPNEHGEIKASRNSSNIQKPAAETVNFESHSTEAEPLSQQSPKSPQNSTKRRRRSAKHSPTVNPVNVESHSNEIESHSRKIPESPKTPKNRTESRKQTKNSKTSHPEINVKMDPKLYTSKIFESVIESLPSASNLEASRSNRSYQQTYHLRQSIFQDLLPPTKDFVLDQPVCHYNTLQLASAFANFNLNIVSIPNSYRNVDTNFLAYLQSHLTWPEYIRFRILLQSISDRVLRSQQEYNGALDKNALNLIREDLVKYSKQLTPCGDWNTGYIANTINQRLEVWLGYSTESDDSYHISDQTEPLTKKIVSANLPLERLLFFRNIATTVPPFLITDLILHLYLLSQKDFYSHALVDKNDLAEEDRKALQLLNHEVKFKDQPDASIHLEQSPAIEKKPKNKRKNIYRGLSAPSMKERNQMYLQYTTKTLNGKAKVVFGEQYKSIYNEFSLHGAYVTSADLHICRSFAPDSEDHDYSAFYWKHSDEYNHRLLEGASAPSQKHNRDLELSLLDRETTDHSEYAQHSEIDERLEEYDDTLSSSPIGLPILGELINPEKQAVGQIEGSSSILPQVYRNLPTFERICFPDLLDPARYTPHKLFVNNIHSEMCGEELRYAFRRCGDVVSGEIYRERRRTQNWVLTFEEKLALRLISDKTTNYHRKKREVLTDKKLKSSTYAAIYFRSAEGLKNALAACYIFGLYYKQYNMHVFATKHMHRLIFHVGLKRVPALKSTVTRFLTENTSIPKSSILRIAHLDLTENKIYADFSDHATACTALNELLACKEIANGKSIKISWGFLSHGSHSSSQLSSTSPSSEYYESQHLADIAARVRKKYMSFSSMSNSSVQY